MRYNDIIENLVILQNNANVLQSKNVSLSMELFSENKDTKKKMEIINEASSIVDKLEENERKMRQIARKLHIEMKITDFAKSFCKKLNEKVYPYVFDVTVKEVYPSSAGFRSNADVMISCNSFLEQKKQEHIMDLVDEGVYKEKEINKKMKEPDSQYIPDEVLFDFSQGESPKLDMNTDLGKLVYSIGSIPICSKAKFEESSIDILADSLETLFQIIPKGLETVCKYYLTPNNKQKVENTPENVLFSSVLKEILIEELEKTKDENEINVEAQQAFPISPNIK